MEPPQTRYTKSGNANIAYQVAGTGPVDLVYVIGWVSNIDVIWEEPSYARFLQRLASFSRLIVFDKRGTGLSDRVDLLDLPTMEQRMDDMRAVMDAAGTQGAALLGISEGGPLCLLFAATYPQRTQSVTVIGGYASGTHAAGDLGARTDEEWSKMIDWVESHWGEDAARESLRDRAPSVYNDIAFRAWWERYLRLSVSPGAAAALSRMNREIDVRPALRAVQAPTLIVHATGDRTIRVANGRFLAKHIANAQYIELDSIDHIPWVVEADAETCVQGVERLVTGGVAAREEQQTRVLATLLYTDIVNSTARAAELGDEAWKALIASHDEIARQEVERARGRLIKTLGDGVLATFDGPARAIRCAAAIRTRVAPIGLEIRAGLHTGEIELTGEDVTGIAAAIGSRVSSLAQGNEILVSSTVKDLVVGSGIEFEECGSHELKGVPGAWAIYRVMRA